MNTDKKYYVQRSFEKFSGTTYEGTEYYDGLIQNRFQLEPVTIEQILSEHPEVVKKIFNDARSITPDGLFKYSGHPKYPTAQDYIDSLKPTQP
jgi:hypothetical protein